MFNIDNYYSIKDAWNRVIIEVSLAQSTSIDVGSSSGRIWINGTGMARQYFGDASTDDTIFHNSELYSILLCAEYQHLKSAVNTSMYANYDMMNFVFYKSSQTAWVNYSGSLI